MRRRAFLTAAMAAAVAAIVFGRRHRARPGLAGSTLPTRVTGRSLAVDLQAPSRFLFQASPRRLTGVALADAMDTRGWRPTSDLTTLAASWHANAVRLSVIPALYRDRRAAELCLFSTGTSRRPSPPA